MDVPSRSGRAVKKAEWAATLDAPAPPFHLDILFHLMPDDVERKLAATVTGTARSPPAHPA